MVNHRSSLLLLCTLCIVVLGLSGCYYDNEAELYPNSYCDTTNITYSGSIAAIMSGNCATPGCHVTGGSGTGDFTNYSGVKSQVDNGRLLPSVRRESTSIPMPPTGSLRDCDIKKLEIWVQQGAPNN